MFVQKNQGLRVGKMKVHCTVKGVSTTLSLKKIFTGKGLLAILTVFVICFSVNSADAISTTKASGLMKNLEETNSLQTTPSRDMGDVCLPLLKKVRHMHTSSIDPRRRPAGRKAATVGFVLGLRTALGPTEANGSADMPSGYKKAIAITGMDDHQALKIAAYRACKNAQALEALSSR